MWVNVQDMLARREPVRMTASLDVAPLFAQSKEVQAAGPMRADVTLTPADGMIDASGELTGNLRLSCSRCLGPVDSDYRIPYRETFKPMPKGEEREERDDEDFVPVSGERFDLTPYLEDELLLSLPYAPLCREDCAGLCPECGANRNEETCGCAQERIDPRLAALQNWFQDR